MSLWGNNGTAKHLRDQNQQMLVSWHRSDRSAERFKRLVRLVLWLWVFNAFLSALIQLVRSES